MIGPETRRAQITASALAALAADADEIFRRTLPQTETALYTDVFDVVAAEWRTAPALVHMAYESAPIGGRLPQLAHLGLEERNAALLELADEYCRRILAARSGLRASRAAAN